jgi:hypothetical protein
MFEELGGIWIPAPTYLELVGDLKGEKGAVLTSPSSEACSRIVARWPASEIEIAAANPPSPAPTIAMCN